MTIRHRIRRARTIVRNSGKDKGMTTAEYAVGTLAACAFAAVLLAIVRSGGIKDLVTGVIESALALAS